MYSLTLTALAASVCVALAVLRGPRWLLVGAVVGTAGCTVVKRYGAP